MPSPLAYFKLNSAFTCAVTVTVCGVNSSVGAGARRGHRRHRTRHARHHDPRILKRVDRSIGKFAQRPPAGASQSLSGVARPAVRVFHRLVLRVVNIFERVTQRLRLAHVGVGELLRDRTHLRKILQLQRDVGRNAISNDLLLRLPFVDGLHAREIPCSQPWDRFRWCAAPAAPAPRSSTHAGKPLAKCRPAPRR